MDTDELLATALETRMLVTVAAKTARHALEQRPELAGADIGWLQFGILRVLCRGEKTLSELSRRFLLDPSTLVSSVDALERKKLIKRGHDPRDRRA